MSAADYPAWRLGTQSTHAFWARKIALSRETLASITEPSEGVRLWFEASIIVCEQSQLWNQRFCLLMLLRARAHGEL